MKYLETAVHISVKYEKWNKEHELPPFIMSRYRVEIAYLDGLRTLFLFPKHELENIVDIKNHLYVINQYENIPIVLILQRLTFRQRETMIKLNIPFIVEKKHIYLPFMALITQEKFDKDRIETKNMMGITQLVFLYLIYLNKKETDMSLVRMNLSLNPMAISRAVSQLEDLDLIKTRKENVKKVIVLEMLGEALFKKALPYLNNPVKETIYVYKDKVDEPLLLSSYSALSKLTMLSAPLLTTYACHDLYHYKGENSDLLIDKDEQVEIQKWMYDPRLLSNDDVVDILSLYLILSNDNDVRVEKELENLINRTWRKING